MEELITIRTCNPKDAETLVSLGIRTFRDTFDESNTPENMMAYINKAFTLRKITEELNEPDSIFFLAESRKRAIGYARVRTSKQLQDLDANHPLELQRLYVDKKFIGKRVGHILMHECLSYAKENQHDAMWLGVWELNPRAIAFYIKWGFSQFGQHIFQLGDDAQTDLLFMKKL